MSFYAFRQLSPVVQLYWVIKHGTFLAQRWDDESGATQGARELTSQLSVLSNAAIQPVHRPPLARTNNSASQARLFTVDN